MSDSTFLCLIRHFQSLSTFGPTVPLCIIAIAITLTFVLKVKLKGVSFTEPVLPQFCQKYTLDLDQTCQKAL